VIRRIFEELFTDVNRAGGSCGALLSIARVPCPGRIHQLALGEENCRPMRDRTYRRHARGRWPPSCTRSIRSRTLVLDIFLATLTTRRQVWRPFIRVRAPLPIRILMVLAPGEGGGKGLAAPSFTFGQMGQHSISSAAVDRYRTIVLEIYQPIESALNRPLVRD